MSANRRRPGKKVGLKVYLLPGGSEEHEALQTGSRPIHVAIFHCVHFFTKLETRTPLALITICLWTYYGLRTGSCVFVIISMHCILTPIPFK